MLKRTITFLFIATVFAVGGIGCASKSMKKSDLGHTVEGDHLAIPRDASVPSSKRIVVQERDGNEVKDIE